MSHPRRISLPPLQDEPKRDLYVKKFEAQIQPLENEDEEKDVKTLTSQIFPKDFYYLPDHPYKTREFYEQILLETQSVIIDHYPNTKYPSQIGFSRIKIARVMTREEWRQHPFTNKMFSQKIPGQELCVYNYHDYQKAWFRIFWYKPIFHSWSIYFVKTCQRTFPRWWIDWFKKIGPAENLFQPEIRQAIRLFTRYADLEGMTEDPMLQYLITFAVPWIICWEFGKTVSKEEKMTYLVRIIKHKIWQKYEVKRACVQAVKELLKISEEEVTQCPSAQESMISQISSVEHMQKAYKGQRDLDEDDEDDLFMNYDPDRDLILKYH